MHNSNFRIIQNKVIMHTTGRLSETAEELLSSELFALVLRNCIAALSQQRSMLMQIFDGDVTEEKINVLLQTLKQLTHIEAENVPKILPASAVFFRDRALLNDFVEHLYNFWRSFERYIICDSANSNLDRKPYRTFNSTINSLTQLIRGTYRDIQENITGTHPRIYRQVVAGAEIASITVAERLPLPGGLYEKLQSIKTIRQILLNPPLILEPTSNKRSGSFKHIDVNPLGLVNLDPDEWLCFPVKAGELLIHVYFHEKFFELGFSLCNLFELADDEDLKRKPDGVYLYGVPGSSLDTLADPPTVFFDDEASGILVGACPNGDFFGYFGYLKKMILTLHNVVMMKKKRMPFHGALIKIMLKNRKSATILMMGDTGAGKSETLEAFRNLGREMISETIVIADDMGSLMIDDKKNVIGYGTEIGAFLRIDDLRQGYAFGQIDRSIIMNASQTNARIIIPVASYDTIMKGEKIDMILYANNYEQVDDEHPLIERFNSIDRAFECFREGTVMSKGTTTSTGIVHSYFANIFGPAQYREMHDELAMDYFRIFFDKNLFVGQMRTRLGIKGFEQSGPEAAAAELLKIINGE